MEKIRVVVAEDHHVVRVAVAALLDRELDIEVVGEVSCGQDILPTVSELMPDVLLLDAHMPGHRVIDTVRSLYENLEDVRVLILSAYERREYVYGLLSEGVSGYILKDDAPDMLVKAIHLAANGQQYLSPRITHIVLRAAKEKQIPLLTARELETLKWMTKGMSNEQIAREMVVTVQTVRNYVHRIFVKLNASSRVEAVLIAIKLNLVPDPTKNDN